MSQIKQVNNQPSKYQELNDGELEVVCGGTYHVVSSVNTNAKDFIPETIAFTKTEAA